MDETWVSDLLTDLTREYQENIDSRCPTPDLYTVKLVFINMDKDFDGPIFSIIAPIVSPNITAVNAVLSVFKKGGSASNKALRDWVEAGLIDIPDGEWETFTGRIVRLAEIPF